MKGAGSAWIRGPAAALGVRRARSLGRMAALLGSTAAALLGLAAALLAACDAPAVPPGSDELAEVELRTVAELDFDDAPTLPGAGGLVALDPASGVAAFVDRQVPYEILLFSNDGTFQARLGAAGDGPGEFDLIQALAFDGSGALWAVSRGGTRADVFSADFELDRSMTLERAVVRLAPLDDDRFLAVVQAPEGPALVRLGPDGTSEHLAAPWDPGVEAQLVAVTTDGAARFWAASPHAFRILAGVAADDPGEVELDELPLDEPEWFGEQYPATFQDEFQSMLDTRGATILGLRYDADTGLLWLTAGVPSSSVEAAAVRAAFEGGGPELLEGLPAMLIDHVVMALDAETGAPVAEARFDFLNLPLAGDPPYEIRDGTIVEVLRPEVRR